MLVYVLHQNGQPLMPCKSARAKHLLDAGGAKVVHREPFTIQLTTNTSAYVQSVAVGVDLGAKTVGVAAVGNGRVLYQGEVRLRDDIRKRMDRRRAYRRSRRSRKCRYRKPRFDNRAASRRKGRLPPTIKSKSDTTVKVVRRVASFLSVSAIRVEMANFDTHAMREGKRRLPNRAYQRGELYQWENIKMYIRARDNYTCQYCGVIMPPDLEVDHIVPHSRGGSDRSDNLVAACHDCNQLKGNRTATKFGHPQVQERAKRPLRAAAHTQASKTETLNALREIAPVETTYGYVTKLHREAMGLSKTHYYDAVVIASGGVAVRGLPFYEAMQAVAKGVYRQRKGDRSHLIASLPYKVHGFRQWDRVRLPNGRIGFVKGRRSSGYFAISDVNGNLIAPSVNYRRLRLIGRANTLLMERRQAAFSPPEVRGLHR